MLVPRIVQQTATQRAQHHTQNSVSKNRYKVLNDYCSVTAIMGAVVGFNESFWENLRMAQYDKRKLVLLPITATAGITIGAIAGICFLPSLMVCVAYERFKTAYEERKRYW